MHLIWRFLGQIISSSDNCYAINVVKFRCSVLGRNPYHCDCNMTWFIDRLNRDDFPSLVDDRLNIICASPEKLAGMKIVDIIYDDISLCPQKIGKLEPYLIFFVCLFVCSLVGLFICW